MVHLRLTRVPFWLLIWRQKLLISYYLTKACSNSIIFSCLVSSLNYSALWFDYWPKVSNFTKRIYPKKCAYNVQEITISCMYVHLWMLINKVSYFIQKKKVTKRTIASLNNTPQFPFILLEFLEFFFLLSMKTCFNWIMRYHIESSFSR